jgi:hypothetical protein
MLSVSFLYAIFVKLCFQRVKFSITVIRINVKLGNKDKINTSINIKN